MCGAWQHDRQPGAGTPSGGGRVRPGQGQSQASGPSQLQRAAATAAHHRLHHQQRPAGAQRQVTRLQLGAFKLWSCATVDTRKQVLRQCFAL